MFVARNRIGNVTSPALLPGPQPCGLPGLKTGATVRSG
jgi:hypothetical protein